MENLNPIIALAGAAVKSGNGIFAKQLLELDRGNRDCKAMKKRKKRFSGMTLSSVAYCIDSAQKQKECKASVTMVYSVA